MGPDASDLDFSQFVDCRSLERTGGGGLVRSFADWPNPAVPEFGAGVSRIDAALAELLVAA
jgi:hypothetical protein